MNNPLNKKNVNNSRLCGVTLQSRGDGVVSRVSSVGARHPGEPEPRLVGVQLRPIAPKPDSSLDRSPRDAVLAKGR